MKLYSAIIFIVLMNSFSVNAHGDLHERILQTTAEIEQSPDSTYLYFKRGKLYYQHEEFLLSVDDLEKSIDMGNSDLLCYLYISKSLLNLAQHKQSLEYVSRILSEKPQSVNAMKIQAENYFALGKYEEAANIYEKVINITAKTFPENYLIASTAWSKLNTTSGIRNSVAILKNGIEELGPIFTLQSSLQEIYIANNEFTLALEIQNELIQKANRKEHAYYKAFEIAIMLDDLTLCTTYLNKCNAAIEILPISKQNTSAIIELKQKVKTQLETLKTIDQ